VATSIRLSPEISKRLDWLASKTGRPKSFYLRLFIESGLSDMEDYYMAADAREQSLKEHDKVLTAPVARKVPGLQD
jgi:RHH-type rel operon transcriptional repressor/antitoxin RelB